MPAGSRWATASNSRTEPATAALSDPIAPRIGMRMNRSQRRRIGGPEALTLAADHDRERAAQVGLARGQRRVRLRAGDPQAVGVEVGEGARQVVDRAQQEVLGRARPTP